MSDHAPSNAHTVLSTTRPGGVRHAVDRWIVRHQTRRGVRFRHANNGPFAVFAHDHVGIVVNQKGRFELDQLTVLFELLEPLRDAFSEGVALDVGANIGNHTIWFAARFGHVHAFEPHPDTLEILRLNARWAGGNVTVHPIGLSGRDRTAQLDARLTTSLRSRVATDPSHPGPSAELRRLDGLELDLDRLCFVKIDVEGHEYPALAGAEQTIRTHRPIVVFEQHRGDFDGDESPAIRLLRDWGYRFCWHTAGSASSSLLRKRLTAVGEVIRGTRRHTVVAGPDVPTRFHHMLIAVPAEGPLSVVLP